MITANQRKILICFTEPEQSYADVGQKLGVQREYIYQEVLKLIDMGLAKKTPFIPRTVRLTKKGRDAAGRV